MMLNTCRQRCFVLSLLLALLVVVKSFQSSQRLLANTRLGTVAGAPKRRYVVQNVNKNRVKAASGVAASALKAIIESTEDGIRAKSPLKIAIAGCGVGGLFAGYCLQKKGFEVTRTHMLPSLVHAASLSLFSMHRGGLSRPWRRCRCIQEIKC